MGLSARAGVFEIFAGRVKVGCWLFLSSHLESGIRYSVFADTICKIKSPQPVHRQLKAVPINTALKTVVKIEPSRPFLLFAGGSSDSESKTLIPGRKRMGYGMMRGRDRN